MAATRSPGEVSRVRLIEAAAAIMNEQGFAALSARTLAERVGLKRQIVHYYFGTVDELLLAVVRHYGELGLAEFACVAAGNDPLRVIWRFEPDISATTFAFLALARHRPAIRDELRRYLLAFRAEQAAAIERYASERKLTLSMPALAAVIIVQSVAQSLTAEASLGADMGHEETRAAIEQLLPTIML